MAITSVGKGATSVGTTGTVFPSWPAGGYAVNDIGIVVVETSGDVAASLQSAHGFTLLDSVSSAGAGTGALTRADIFWARATSTSMGSPVFNGQADHQWATMFVFRGVSTTETPGLIRTMGSGVNTATETTLIAPSVTTTVPNCVVLTGFSYSADSGSNIISAWSNSNGLTPTVYPLFGTSSGDGGGAGVAWLSVPTAGATGTTQAACAIASAYAPFSIVLKPAPDTATGNFLPFFL